MQNPERRRFRFGHNWARYVRKVDERRIDEARKSLEKLLSAAQVAKGSFLDVGCGSGIFACAAAQLGFEKVVGIDIDPASVEAARWLSERLGTTRASSFLQGDILNPPAEVSAKRYDLVYAWGSLHHTGHMYEAIDRSLGLVKPGGLFVVALYNASPLAPLWLRIKWLYGRMPGVTRWLMVAAFFSAVAAFRLLTFRHPLRKRRGMHTFYDTIDWLGGLPYEHAAPGEIVRFIGGRGALCLGMSRVGHLSHRCNEYVFRKGFSEEPVSSD